MATPDREDLREALEATALGVERVATGLLRRGGRVLLCHRTPSRRWYPDCWDAPGGHLEPGEEPGEALVRELHEELGVTVAAPGPPVLRRRFPDWSVDGWVLDAWAGEPENRAPDEHDALAWVDAAGAAALHLADPYVLELVRAALPAWAPPSTGRPPVAPGRQPRAACSPP